MTDHRAQVEAWYNGTPTGGPMGDGRYPLTDSQGVEHLVYCPVMEQAMDLEDQNQFLQLIEDAQVAAAAAEAAALAAAGSVSAAEAARDAAIAASSAASTSATNAGNSATAAAGSASAASTSATNAGNSATAAAGSATAAGTAKTQAEAASALAQKWSSEAPDVVVASGMYSAYHWASKAAALVAAVDMTNYYDKTSSDSRFFNVTGDTVDGNITFGGVGRRFLADFTNATQTNRFHFQSSVVDGTTSVPAMPNGTAQVALFAAFNSSDSANAGTFQLRMNATQAVLNSLTTGTGVLRDISFQFGGVQKALLDVNGAFTVSAGITATGRIRANRPDNEWALVARNEAGTVDRGGIGCDGAGGALWNANFNAGIHLSDAGTVGVSGNVTIASNKTLSMGSGVGQRINLWAASYGIGIQNNTQYFRSGSAFAWHIGGTHDDNEANPGTGGTCVMQLHSASGGSLGIGGATGGSSTAVAAHRGTLGTQQGHYGLYQSGVRIWQHGIETSRNYKLWAYTDGGAFYQTAMEMDRDGTVTFAGRIRATTNHFNAIGAAAVFSTGSPGPLYLRPNGPDASAGQTVLAASGKLSVAGIVSSEGSSAMLAFDRRDAPGDAYAWGWYSSGGRAHLWKAGIGERISVAENGDFFTGAAVFPGGDGTCYLHRNSSSQLAINQHFRVAGDMGVGTNFSVDGTSYMQSIYSGNWFRTQNFNCGWYHEQGGGGWWMTDTSWVRNYNQKPVSLDTGVGSTQLELRGYSNSIAFVDTENGISTWLHHNDQQIGFLQNNAFSWAMWRDSGNNFGCVGNVTAYASDKRLKTAITDADRSKIKVFFDEFQVREFDWNQEAIDELNPGFNPTAQHEVGAIAQEAPEWMVATHKHNGIKTIMWDKAVPYLIAEVQDLRSTVAKQQAMLESLAARLAELEAR